MPITGVFYEQVRETDPSCQKGSNILYPSPLQGKDWISGYQTGTCTPGGMQKISRGYVGEIV